jgi:uncharacterized damage-inducible protein DinB
VAAERDRLEIIETLKHLPDVLTAELAGLPDEVLSFRAGEGEWSIRETAGHICDAAEVWSKRLHMVWSMSDPLFVSFDGEAWVRERGYQDRPLHEVIEEMRPRMLAIVNLLSHAVDWTRTGMQPGVGRRSLKQFAEFVIEHFEGHQAQIRSTREAYEAQAKVAGSA